MSVKILSITLLLLSAYLCCHTSAARHPGKPPQCCKAVTTRNMSAEVVGQTYSEQAAAQHCVKAIIFNTLSRKLCADPKAQWVKNLIAKMKKV